jgi:hypothetical protein
MYHSVGVIGSPSVPLLESPDQDEWEKEDVDTGLDDLIEKLRSVKSHSEYDRKTVTEMEREEKCKPRIFQSLTNENTLIKREANEVNAIDAERKEMIKRMMDDAEAMQKDNRVLLNRFDPLRMNDQSLTGVTIAGFKVDIPMVITKIQELAPLPESKLPNIFVDQDLNFFHHFFKGMEMLLSEALFNTIVRMSRLIENGDVKLITKLHEFMHEGYKEKDTELTVLVKKVLRSTFDTSAVVDKSKPMMGLLVVANLWGFRYIEPGMRVSDAELKMWLHNSYQYYHTLWFDTFKSSGVPAFAREGVIQKSDRGLINYRGSTQSSQVTHHKRESHKDHRRSTKGGTFDHGAISGLKKSIGWA